MRLILSATETRLLQAQSSLSRVSLANAARLRERAQELVAQAEEVEELAHREIATAVELIAEAHDVPEDQRRDLVRDCTISADMSALDWDPVEPAPSLEEARAELQPAALGESHPANL